MEIKEERVTRGRSSSLLWNASLFDIFIYVRAENYEQSFSTCILIIACVERQEEHKKIISLYAFLLSCRFNQRNIQVISRIIGIFCKLKFTFLIQWIWYNRKSQISSLSLSLSSRFYSRTENNYFEFSTGSPRAIPRQSLSH